MSAESPKIFLPEGGVLTQVSHDGGYIWKLKGAAHLGELIGVLPEAEVDPENQERAKGLLYTILGETQQLFTEGGFMDEKGKIWDAGLRALGTQGGVVDQLKEKGVERYTAKKLAALDIQFQKDPADPNTLIKRGVFYGFCPCFNQQLIPGLDKQDNLFYIGKLPNFNGDVLTTVERHLLPTYIMGLETEFGVRPVYTAPSIARAAIFTSVPNQPFVNISRG